MSDPVIAATSEDPNDADETSSVAGDFAIQIAKSRSSFVNVISIQANAASAAAAGPEADAEAGGAEVDDAAVGNSSADHLDVAQEDSIARSPSGVPVDPDSSIEEYFQLRRELVIITLALTALAIISVWLTYGGNIALNYLIGACTGLLYLNMLGKHVGQLGRQRARLGNSRLALLVGVILIASRVNQLEILPIFLGFLTYKAALIVYVLKSVIVSD